MSRLTQIYLNTIENEVVNKFESFMGAMSKPDQLEKLSSAKALVLHETDRRFRKNVGGIEFLIDAPKNIFKNTSLKLNESEEHEAVYWIRYQLYRQIWKCLGNLNEIGNEKDWFIEAYQRLEHERKQLKKYPIQKEGSKLAYFVGGMAITFFLCLILEAIFTTTTRPKLLKLLPRILVGIAILILGTAYWGRPRTVSELPFNPPQFPFPETLKKLAMQNEKQLGVSAQTVSPHQEKPKSLESIIATASAQRKKQQPKENKNYTSSSKLYSLISQSMSGVFNFHRKNTVDINLFDSDEEPLDQSIESQHTQKESISKKKHQKQKPHPKAATPPSIHTTQSSKNRQGLQTTHSENLFEIEQYHDPRNTTNDKENEAVDEINSSAASFANVSSTSIAKELVQKTDTKEPDQSPLLHHEIKTHNDDPDSNPAPSLVEQNIELPVTKKPTTIPGGDPSAALTASLGESFFGNSLQQPQPFYGFQPAPSGDGNYRLF